ncbi:MAG: long-chain fatty acid--CoA ligase [Nannocystaceae bacterium]
MSRSSRTLAELFRRRCEQSGPFPSLYQKEAEGGDWRCTTWSDFYDLAARAAAGLVELGLDVGDRVAILGPTRVAWCVYDMAAQLAGLVSFGVYAMQTPEQIRYLLTHSGARAIFVDGAEELESVLQAVEAAPELVAIIPWSAALYREYAGADPRIVDPERFAGAPLSPARVRARGEAREADDVAILIYTSGTTGPPKAAMISHGNVLSLLRAWEPLCSFVQDDISLSFLPMAHAAERILAFYGRIDTGIATAYATRVAAVLDELREVEPTLFGSVPRVYEKAHAKIYGEVERKPPAVRRLFKWAIGVGKARVRRELAGAPPSATLELQAKVADRLVFRTIRAAFGGRVREMITGAAPIDREILEFFWGVGLPIYECYGMTEATVITHLNRKGATRLTSVGQALTGLECRIAADGEVLLRAPWVFKGYYRNDEATAAAIVDGWLHSGDIGEIDDDGYLYIKDRKKHLIITAGGKNLAPANIEKAIKGQDPLISHVHAHGDRRPFVVAVIAPSPIETLEFGRARGLVSADEVAARTAELLENPAARSPELAAAMAAVTVDPSFRRRVQEAVGRGNRELAHVEQVRRFTVLGRDFSQEEGELTPTLKVKRSAIEGKLAGEFARIYDEAGYALEPV